MDTFKELAITIVALLCVIMGGVLIVFLYVMAIISPIALVAWVFGRLMGVW